MKYLRSKLLLAAPVAAVVSTALLPMPAQAVIKTMKMHYVEGQFTNPPTIVMRNNSNNWIWDNKNDSFQIAAKIKLHAVGNRISSAYVFIGSQQLWGTPGNTKKFWKLEKLVKMSLNKKHMAHLVPSAANLCAKHGTNKKVIKPMPSVTTFGVDYENGKPSKVIAMPVRVICLAKQPSRVPASLKVTNLKLYTVPKKPRCGKPVMLVAEIHTTKPGKVNFQLRRRDGAKDDASLTTKKAGNGYAKLWSRQYKFTKSVNREYMVILKGHPLSTNWVPLKVSCGFDAGNKRPRKLTN